MSIYVETLWFLLDCELDKDIIYGLDKKIRWLYKDIYMSQLKLPEGCHGIVQTKH